MRLKNINWWYVVGILAVFIIVFLLAVNLRTDNGTILFVGSESYVHLNNVLSSQPQQQITFYELILKSALSIFTLQKLFFITNILFASLIFLLFTFLSISFSKSELEVYLSLIIFTLTTPLLFLFLGFFQKTFIALLGLLALEFFSLSEGSGKFRKKHKKLVFNYYWFVLSLLVIAIIFFINSFVGIFAIFFFVLHKLVNRSLKEFSISLFSFVLLLGLVQWLRFQFGFFHSPIFSSFHSLMLNSLFSFFGSLTGYTLFIFILGIGGAIITNRVVLSTSKFFLLAVLILSLFNEYFLIFGLLIMVFYSGIAFNNILEKKWIIEYLRQLTIILLICILLFSLITNFKILSSQEPTSSQVSALQKISVYDVGESDNCTILTTSSDDVFVKYFTGLDTPSNNLFNTSKYSSFFDIQNFDEVRRVFKEGNICYVHFDDSKKTIFERNRPPEGLDFIIRYMSEDFTKIYDSNGQRIYHYDKKNDFVELETSLN